MKKQDSKTQESYKTSSQYNIFNLNKDSRLDNLLEIVCDYFSITRAIISFVDEKKVWRKSSTAQGPCCLDRQETLCSFVVEKNQIVVAANLRESPELSSHSMVTTDPSLCFFMGAPIISLQGNTLGAICIYDNKPRNVTKSNKDFLNNISKQVSFLIDSDHQYELCSYEKKDFVNQKTDLEVLHYCSDLGMWKWDLTNDKVLFDRRWCEIVGYDVNEIKHHFSTFEKLAHPDDLPRVLNSVDRYLSGEIDFYEVVFRLKHKKGHWVTILSKGKSFRNQDGTPILFCGTHFDMTQVKKMEDDAAHFQKLSNEIQRMGEIGAWEINVGKNEILWTEGIYRVHGIKTGDCIDFDSAIEFYLPHERVRIQKQIEDCINKKEKFVDDFEFQDARGIQKWVRVYGEPTYDEKGGVTKIMGTFQDISYQKELEISLRLKNSDLKSKEMQLQMVIDSTYDGIWDWHIAKDFEYMSPRFWEMLGYEPEEKKHHPSEWEALIFPEDKQTLQESYEKHIESHGQSPLFEEIRFTHKNGSTVWVLCRGQVVEWSEKGEPIRMTGAHTDITEIKQAQMSLQENAKLIALGEMAGGVAHEINNPLAIISSSAEALSRVIKRGALNDDPIVNKFVSNIQSTVTRISKIVDGLKKLSRQSDNEDLSACDLHGVIMDSLALSSEKFRAMGVELSIDLYETVSVLCRPVELSQVIINLLNNAYHVVLDKQDPRVNIQVVDERKGFVSIEVQDNGGGVPEHLVEKIMEPFFTTKPVGVGTGLGLSISREIMESMGGGLRLRNGDKGAVFIIDLKRATKTHPNKRAA